MRKSLRLGQVGRGFAFLLAILLGWNSSSARPQNTSLDIARAWVERLSATMQQQASPSDVDRLLDLYADDAVYEHPHANARIQGKQDIRKGISSHLGETRSPRIEITQTLAGEDFAVIELAVAFELHQAEKWLPLQRRQVVVLEFKHSRIQRIIDHWGR